MNCAQIKITLPAYNRGCHLITDAVIREMPELRQIHVGLLHVFIQHTSACLTLNENADPDERADMEMALNKIVPENYPYLHTAEGADDMPAHVKSSLFGHSLSIPISNGKLALGVWQGIYLCEHRDRANGCSLILTLMGQSMTGS